jgi:hypothetical protein
MAKYDLTGGLETKFTFNIDDKEFEFRKPTVREMRAMLKKFTAVEKEKNPDKQLALSDEAMADLYAFVVPVGHDTPIAEAMDEQTIATQTAFNEMIKKELGAQS